MKITRTTPFEYSGRTAQGTIKRTHIKKTVTAVVEIVDTEIEFKIPMGYTFDEFGEYHKSNNAYKYNIKTIKQPKKRKARMNAKIENAVQTNAYNGAMYQNAERTVQKESERTNNKRKKKQHEKSILFSNENYNHYCNGTIIY